MKITKCALPLLLCSTLLVSGCGCSSAAKTKVEDVIISELDLLKNLDPDTTQKYVSYTELFPDAENDTELSPDVEEVFSLFFQDFDYKILDIKMGKNKESASASIRLSTIDANSLARDFAAARLQDEILASARSTEQPASASLENYYLILGDVLKNNTYETKESNCSMTLKEDNDTWQIQRTKSLENQLVGGFLTYLTNPDILPPQETVTIYLDTLKDMDDTQISNYLGMSSLLASENPSWNTMATAVAQQLHKNFSYEIKDSKEDGYSATVNVAFTTFDSQSILDKHQALLDEYLASADAVIDGSAKRLEKSHQILVDTIRNNEATVVTEIPLTLINNGASWEIEMDDNQLGKALFGNLAQDLSTPVETTEFLASDGSLLGF